MKKIVATICLFCYTASAIGLSLSFSFCNNELTGVIFSKTEKNNRCCCSDENECCEHTTIIAKITNEHYRFESISFVKKSDNSTPPTNLPSANPIFSYVLYPIKSTPLFRSPSLIEIHSPLYIMHSVFRI